MSGQTCNAEWFSYRAQQEGRTLPAGVVHHPSETARLAWGSLATGLIGIVAPYVIAITTLVTGAFLIVFAFVPLLPVGAIVWGVKARKRAKRGLHARLGTAGLAAGCLAAVLWTIPYVYFWLVLAYTTLN